MLRVTRKKEEEEEAEVTASYRKALIFPSLSRSHIPRKEAELSVSFHIPVRACSFVEEDA